MKAFVLSQTDLLVYPLIAVVMFSAIFMLVLAWVYRPGGREIYAERGRMVLDNDDPIRSSGGAR